MCWIYQGTEINELPETCVGFVYMITNQLTGKKYIGKKLSKFSKTKYKVLKLKNGVKKKKKIKSMIDSDWKDYWSSSDALKDDVVNFGKENFIREILYFCSSKSELSYLELHEQVNRRVLESDEYYNGIINVRIKESELLKNSLLEQRSSGKLI